MKQIFKLLTVAGLVTTLFVACDKVDELPVYEPGVAPALTVNPTSVVLASGNASGNVLNFSWTDPAFATDTANYKYIVQVAPAGKNFANAQNYTVVGQNAYTVTGAELNNLLVKWGSEFGKATSLDTRIVASYLNNNDQKISNTVTVSATPYAVAFSTSSTVNTTFAPTIATKDNDLTTIKWTTANYGTSTASYVLQYDSVGKNFVNAKELVVASGDSLKLTGLQLNIMARDAGIAYGSTGTVQYRIKSTINNTGQVSYSDVKTLSIKPAEMTLFLYMAGDYQGWNPGAAPKLASTDGVNYDGYVWVPAGGSGEFKFTSAPDWNSTNYGGTATMIDPSGGNLKWPATGKYYRVQVNTSTKAWSTTEITTWGVIGNGTPGGWDNSTPLTYDPAISKWKGTINFTSGEFKFRANNGWDINLGGTSTQLTYGGNNIPSTAGSKTVTLDLTNPPYYSYTIQ